MTAKVIRHIKAMTIKDCTLPLPHRISSRRCEENFQTLSGWGNYKNRMSNRNGQTHSDDEVPQRDSSQVMSSLSVPWGDTHSEHSFGRIASKVVKQCPLPCKEGFGEQHAHTPQLMVPATKHILASVTIKWTPDGLNLPTVDETLGTDMCFLHCWQNLLEVHPPHPTPSSFCIGQRDAAFATVRTELEMFKKPSQMSLTKAVHQEGWRLLCFS